jgi:serine/threonine-protein kinase
LDQPTPRLWKALNLYQVGAVLHDLIMKSALFQDEVSLGNRWLVARAVLAKTPSFADANPSRLTALKALSAKCLVKDMDTRLQIVSWSDFALDSAHEPLTYLRSRLERRDPGSLDSSAAALESRLRFDRNNFEKAYIDRVRLELIPICTNKLPLILNRPAPELPFTFEFSYSPSIRFKSTVRIEWLRELQNRTADVYLGEDKVCVVTISEAEDQAVFALSSALAEVVGECLDLVESSSFADKKGVCSVESNRGQVEVE